MNRFLLPLLLLTGGATSQTVYDMPFASSGNVIELTVENASRMPQTALTVKPAQVPPWIILESPEQSIALLPGGERHVIRFHFSIDRTAPVNSNHSLSFIVTSSDGHVWTKTIAVRVSPPQTFGLFQNYPNPFNPTTTISYQLPMEGVVTIRIFNLIGQEMALLAEGMRTAGYHHESWDASAFPSGMYIYQIKSVSTDGREFSERRSMMLVR
jgi:hypothetical protein